MTSQRVRLADVAAVRPGRTPPKLDRYLEARSAQDRTIPFYKVGDMNAATSLSAARTYLSQTEVDDLGLAVLPVGSVVFPKAGGAIATNKKRTVSLPGAIDLNCMGVVPGPDIEPRYLALWFESFDLKSIQDGSVLPQISKARVSRLEIPMSPIDKQRRIVDILEDHLSRIDAAAQALRSSRERLLVLRLSALHQVRVAALAAGSPLRPIGEIAQTDLGKMLDAKRATGEPTLYLRNVNVRWGQVDLSDVRTVPLTERERTDFALQRGDLLVCEGGEPGRCAIWTADGAMTYQKALHRVRVRHDADVSVEFLALMIEEFIRTGRANRLFTGTTIKHLPQEKLRAIELPVPAIRDQHNAVREVGEARASADRLDREILRAGLRAKVLRRTLLRAAFSGELTAGSFDLDGAAEALA